MSDTHVTHSRDNFTVSFHPAFVSRAVVKHEDGESEVYKQTAPHHLNGETHPKKHTIRIKGGKYERDVTLHVEDPKHAIKHIHLELYPHRDEAHIGTNQLYAAAESVSFENTAVTCPPMCVTGP